MKRKPTMLTVTDSRHVPVGGMMRVTATGDVLYVSGASVWHRDAVERVGFWRGLWRWLCGHESFGRYRVDNVGTHTLRVWKWRPSPLPHRLP